MSKIAYPYDPIYFARKWGRPMAPAIAILRRAKSKQEANAMAFAQGWRARI